MALDVRASTAPAVRVAFALTAVTVAAQISYPLLSGSAADSMTVVIVLLFAAATTATVAAAAGARTAGYFLGCAVGVGLLAETLGVHTGFPFGEYAYAGTLGPQLLGVPVVIALAWAMMSYPALVVARVLAGAGSRWLVAAVGGLALASWDLFLDPQMVAAGHWTWAFPEPSLPGAAGIPVTNFVGWYVVSVMLIALLDRVIPRFGPYSSPAPSAASAPHPRSVPELLAGAMYLWTYVSSVLLNAVFVDRSDVALLGGIGMGLVAIPYAFRFTAAIRNRPAAG